MAKKRRRAVVPEIMDYYVQIESWKPQIGLGVDHSRVSQKPYWEDYGVRIQGLLVAPKTVRKFEIRGLPIDVTITGERSISRIVTQAEEKTDDRKPRGVGTIQGLKKAGVPWALLSASMEQVPIIVTLLCHERVRFLSFRGDVLLRGSANILSWDLKEKLDPDDDPGILPLA